MEMQYVTFLERQGLFKFRTDSRSIEIECVTAIVKEEQWFESSVF